MDKEIIAKSVVDGLNPVVLMGLNNANNIEYLVFYGRNKVQTKFLEVAKKQYFKYVQQQMNDKLI